MKRTNIIYWIITGLLALLMAFSGVANIIAGPPSEEVFNHIHFPLYMIRFLGVAKLLGAIAIIIPGFPRLKEWAYAGLTFDLVGATYAAISVGDPVKNWAPILIGIILIAVSYIFFHKKRKLEGKE